VLRIIEPIWLTKNETASRVRGRIEKVLDFAKARGLRSGDNPAAWKGNLDALLARRTKLKRGHHKAMPFDSVPSFMAALRERPAISARALEFLVLTAARSGETFGATWQEVDLKERVWSVPGERMKAGKDHRVPLSPRATAILDDMKALAPEAQPGDLIFPGPKVGKPLSDMATSALLKRMKVDATTHGFRSSFRDWCGESTAFPREVAEAALAHRVGNEVERAYRRGDALAKRRKLMEAWSAYCEAPRKQALNGGDSGSATVIGIGAAKREKASA
jgi:integrase